MITDVILATPEEVAAVRAKWQAAQPKKSRNLSEEAREGMRHRMSEGVKEAWERRSGENDRWDRIFNEKFADQNYYKR